MLIPQKEKLKYLFALRDGETIHHLVYFYCLCILLAALPTSIYMVSVAQIIMGANWLFERHYRDKFNRFKNNRPALVISSVFLVYMAGIIQTQDLAQGLSNELLNKLPFFTLTFLIASSSPISRDRLYAMLMVFILSVLVTSFIGFVIFLKGDYINPREISPFIMHVYFSIMVVLAIFLLPWTVKQFSDNRWHLYLSLLASLWLFMFLIIMGSLTGILSLVCVILFLAVREIFGKSGYKKKIFASSVLGLTFAGLILLFVFVIRPLGLKIDPEPESLQELTASGSFYRHYTEMDLRENGHLVYYFIAEDELRVSWNSVSTIDFDGTDLKGHELKATLLRYLSSKGLRKDSAAIATLDNKDIRAIEQGTPNYLYTIWPNALIRIHQTFWEISFYKRTGTTQGLSFVQRVELWQVALVAFKAAPVFGWGTGDIFLAMDYGKSITGAEFEKSRLRPHNQFLGILITLGFTGLFLIFGLFIAFAIFSKAFQFLPYNIMLVIVLTAMLGANVLDFQIGLTFFLIFSLFFGIMYQGEK